MNGSPPASKPPSPSRRLAITRWAALPLLEGKHLRSSNFCRNVLRPAYVAADWRDAVGGGRWTWHSLRHVFCTTALFTWKLDAADVSCIAGHANVRTTLLMYVGTVAGVIDRARHATA